jgi:hypothetical protein
LSLFLTKHHAMKTYSESENIYPLILKLALAGYEWSASRPGHFIPRERAPSTHRIEGWVGPRAVLHTVVKRKIPSPILESNCPTRSLVAITNELSRLSFVPRYAIYVCAVNILGKPCSSNVRPRNPIHILRYQPKGRGSLERHFKR